MRTRTRTGLRSVTAAAAALALVLAGCGGGDDPQTAPGDEPGDAAEPGADAGTDADADPDAEPGVELEDVPPITVGTIGIPSIFSMVMPAVAEEAGFYDKYNVDVTSRPMETGVDAARAVQGGDLDIAWSPTGPVMTFAGTGVDVAALMGMDNIDWLVGTTNPDIQACEDLAGETIGVDSVGGARYSVLEIILDSCGLSIDDVDVAGFPGPAAIQAVVADQIQTSVIHIDDVYVIEEQGTQTMEVVAFLADSDPNQHYLVLWTLRSSIDDNRESYVRLLAAYTEAVRWMNDPANEDEVVRIGASATGHSEEVVRNSMADFLELEFWPVDRHGLPEEKLEATIDEQVRLDNIPEGDAPAYDDVVDVSIWEDAFDLVEQVTGS
ncbi:ABC transporter substrate-binding protein [Egicoccus sp. AB-alg6-2]|uniref:ABC transporter substrate-binding protein n=1 Tax=Egicoccus sp. AB-alg6-2 TaxID=3242692 RepID=UPI00359D7C88